MKLHLFFEYIDGKLSQLKKFEDVVEAYRVLISCLQGFAILSKKYGYWKVSPDSIFYTDNSIKVWINEDIINTKQPVFSSVF